MDAERGARRGERDQEPDQDEQIGEPASRPWRARPRRTRARGAATARPATRGTPRRSAPYQAHTAATTTQASSTSPRGNSVDRDHHGEHGGQKRPMVSPQRPSPDVAVRVVGGHELPVRLPEPLDEEPRQRVADQHQPEHPPRPPERPRPDRQRQHREQQQPFEPRLVELRRMPRAGPRPVRRAGLRRLAGKHHRPGRRRRPSPELGVDEVRQPPEEQPDRRRRRHRVADRQDRAGGFSARSRSRRPRPRAVRRETTSPPARPRGIWPGCAR